MALGGYSSSRIFYLAKYKLVALIGSSKLSQADNPALGGYSWKSFWFKNLRDIKSTAPSPSRAKDSVLGGYSVQVFLLGKRFEFKSEAPILAPSHHR